MVNTRTRWAKLVLGVITLLFIGIIYAWSAVLQGQISNEFKWTDMQLTLNFTLSVCFFCIGGLVSGLLAKKISIPVRMIVSAVLIGGGYSIVASLKQGCPIIALYVAYGFMVGTGIGIVYNVVIAGTNSWFPDKKGISNGILMMGFGFSTFILSRVAPHMFKNFGWRSSFIVLGYAVAAVVLAEGFLLKLPPKGSVFPDAKNTLKGAQELQDISTIEMLKRFSFWKLFVFFILFAAVGTTAISVSKNFLISEGADAATTAVTIASVVTVCNGLGRIVSGLIFDRAGLRKTQFVTSGIVIVATGFTLIGAVLSSLPMIAAGLCLCGFTYGFSPTVSAAFSASLYGTNHFALNFSTLNLILIPASFVPTLASRLFETTGSYQNVFIILLAFSVVGLFINISIKKA